MGSLGGVLEPLGGVLEPLAGVVDAKNGVEVAQEPPKMAQDPTKTAPLQERLPDIEEAQGRLRNGSGIGSPGASWAPRAPGGGEYRGGVRVVEGSIAGSNTPLGRRPGEFS